MRPRPSVLRSTARGLSLLLLVAGSTVGLTFTAAPAQAAASLDCLNTLYLADNTSGDTRAVDPATGVVGAAAYDATPAGGTPNQLGVGLNGARSIGTDGTDVVEYDAATGTTTRTPKLTQSGVNGVAGAIDSKNRLFYYGGYTTDSSTLVLGVYDPLTDTSTGPVASIAVPNAPGTNGDLAFDADGTLYFVASSGESTAGAGDAVTALYRLGSALPTSAPQQTFTAVEIARTTGLDGNTNGIAFASDGYLYLGRSNALTQVNPITGATVDTVAMSGVQSTDLGSCAGPSTLSVTADVGGRIAPTDQFTVTASGGDYDGTPAFPVGTTTGTDTGQQDQQGEVAGKAIVLPGDTYTATLGPSGTTDLDKYLVGYRCVDTSTGAVTATGTGTSMPVTVPTGTTGATTACSFTIDVPAPTLTLDASVSPPSFTRVGQTLTYTYVVRNSGNVPLSGFALTNSLNGLSKPTCSPVAQGGALAVDAVTTCTATYVVTAADVAGDADLTDDASVTGTPPPDRGVAPTATDSAAAANAVTGPTANDDSAGTPYGKPVTLPGTGDDADGSTPIVVADTVLTDPAATAGGKTLVIAGVGTWSVNPAGTVTFTPEAGYVGTASTDYRITDENARTDIATLTVTVRQSPTADADAATTKQNVDVVVSVLDNDDPGPRADGTAGSFDPATLKLVLTSSLPTGSTLSTDGRTLTVPGEGVHTVDPATGEVTFDPETAFTDQASTVTYTVRDRADNATGSTYTVTVTAINPTADDDGAKTPFGDLVDIVVLGNDDPGDASAPLVASSVQLTDPAATLGGTRLVVPGEGEWVVSSNGTVTFTPEADFDGAATPVEYRVSDTNGESDTATIIVMVGEDALALPDQGSTPQNTNITVDPLANDMPGDQGTPCIPPGSDAPAGCDSGTFDPTSVAFAVLGQPGGALPTNGGKELVVTGEGTFTIDAVTGEITFDPEAAFAGEASPVTYTVQDSYANTVSASVTVTVRAITPVATSDLGTTPFDTAVTLPAARNDRSGIDDNGTPNQTSDDVAPELVPNTLFPAAGQPQGSMVSLDRKTLTVLGQGVWQVQPNGSVVFTPTGYTGITTPVTYQIEDYNGSTDTATLSVTVAAGPGAVNDTAATQQNVNVTVTPLANDTPGSAADGTPGTWDASSVVFPIQGQPAGAAPSDDGKTLVVANQGTYTIGSDGTVAFDPLPAFSDTATPVTYRVTDSLGNSATATITTTVAAVTPSATDDRARTPHETPVAIDVLANDEGEAGAPLVPATLRLIDPLTDLPVTEVVVPGEGTWTVEDGKLRFVPAADFDGEATPMGYTVEDTNGTTAVASVSVVVETPGATTPVSVTTSQGDPVTVVVLDNATPAGGETLLPATVCLLPATVVVDGTPRGGKAAADDCVRTLTRPDVGTWAVNSDGSVTFSPAPGFVGEAAIDFQVEDTGGNTYQEQLTVAVDAPTTPSAQPAPAAPQAPVQTVAPQDSSVFGLPATGGPAMALLLGGLLSLLAGLAVVRRFRA